MKNFKKIFGIFLGLAMCGTLAACGPKYDVESAKDIIFQNYKNTTSTTASYDLNCQVQIGEDFYPVTWDLTVAEGGDASCIQLGTPANGVVTVTITRDKVVPAVDTEYTLHYVVTDPKGKNPLEGTFTRTVPAFKYATFEEIKAACDAANGSNTEETFDFKGIVVGKSSFSSGKVGYVYVDSGNGALCAYNLTCADEAAWEAMGLGAEIIVSGNAVLYQGTYEFAAGCTYELVKAAPATYTPHFFDLTTAFAAAHNVKTDLVNYQNRLVKLTGVTLGNIGSNNYQYFSLNGVETYLRCSSSSNYLTTAPGDNGTAFYAFFANEWTKGYTADVAGILCCYSGTHYIMPVAATEDYYKVTNRELTTEVKVANTLEEVADTFEEEYVGNQEITLAAAGTTHPEVALTYAVKEGGTGEATINEGKLVINGEKEGTVTVTVTATSGTVTATKDVTFAVALPVPTTIASFIASNDTTNKQYVQGIVVAVDGVGKDCKFIISDGTAALYSNDKKPVKIGDEVLMVGKLSFYYGCPQIASGAILKTVAEGKTETGSFAPITIDELKAIPAGYTGTADEKAAYVAARVIKGYKVTAFLGKDPANPTKEYYNLYDDAALTTKILECTFKDVQIAKDLLGQETAVEVDAYVYGKSLNSAGILQALVVGIGAKGFEFTVVPFNADITLTDTKLGLTSSYKDAAAPITIDGVQWTFTQLYAGSNGIQMNKRTGTQSVLWNVTELAADIDKVTLVYNKDKTPNKAEGLFQITFSTTANFAEGTTVVVPVTWAETDTVKDIACTLEGARYVKLEHLEVSGATYFDEIIIDCK